MPVRVRRVWPRCSPVAAVIVVCLAACGRPPDRRTFEFRGPTMGTTFSVKVVTGAEGLSGSTRTGLDRAIRAELDRIDALMSTWDPESELSRFNRSTTTEPFPVSRETLEVFQWALELARLTDGALDVTMAPLVEAWGFGAGGRPAEPPSDADIARLHKRTGIRHLEVDAVSSTVRKKQPEIACDFSALAPGYAADRLWTLLAAQGHADFLVDVGGELRTRGHNDEGVAWRIGIERPQSVGRAVDRTVSVVDRAIATSGDYRNYYEVDGRRLTHILDPRTGRPIQHGLASVTVIDELAVRADGLSTALMVLGPDAGFALAERLDLAALFIVRGAGGTLSERATPCFNALAPR